MRKRANCERTARKMTVGVKVVRRDYTDVGRTWLRELRQAKNLSQEEVSAAFGKNKDFYGKLERGIRDRRLDEKDTKTLAEVLGTTVEYLKEQERLYKPEETQYRSNPKGLNPNPPTPLTRKIICWWTEDGDSIETICEELSRTRAEVEGILNECIENGEYDAYNRARNLSSRGEKAAPIVRSGKLSSHWRAKNAASTPKLRF